MLKRTLMMAMACLACGAPARGYDLDVQMFPLTGEIRLHNLAMSDVPFVYYSITSNTSGALNSSNLVWKSIADNYDFSGDKFIDPDYEWTKLSATSTQLTEGVFSGPGGSLDAYRSVSLGAIWNPGVVPYTNLAFDIRDPTEQAVNLNVIRALAGDYDASHTVDVQDFETWRQSYGSTTSLAADGNSNGVVDAADYVIWRENFGLSLPGSGSLVQGSGSGMLQVGGAVPEPGTAVLILSAALVALTARARAPRVARRAANRSSARR